MVISRQSSFLKCFLSCSDLSGFDFNIIGRRTKAKMNKEKRAKDWSINTTQKQELNRHGCHVFRGSTRYYDGNTSREPNNFRKYTTWNILKLQTMVKISRMHQSLDDIATPNFNSTIGSYMQYMIMDV